MLDALYHLIPGYSLYHAGNTISSDAPFAIKVRDATMGTTISGFHLIIATEHALKIQAATGSASGGLARTWMTWQRVLPALASVPGAIFGIGIAAVMLGETLEQIYGEHPRITQMKQTWNPTSPRAMQKRQMYSGMSGVPSR